MADNWRQKWDEFFKLFDTLPIQLQVGARNNEANKFGVRHPDQGFGSSDGNHCIFGEYGHITERTTLVTAIVDNCWEWRNRR